MKEVWKKIDGYNEYSISTFGNIRRDNYRGLGYSKMLNVSSGTVGLSNNSKRSSLSISTLMRQNFKKESNTEEIWKKVFLDGFEYSVSNFGQVRNDKTERIMKLTKNQDMDKTGKPFEDTIGIIKNLDLIITADTSLGHLSATLGKKTWIALPFVSDWRWFRDEKKSIWYENVTLYKQKQIGNWEEVFHVIREDLKKEFSNK